MSEQKVKKFECHLLIIIIKSMSIFLSYFLPSWGWVMERIKQYKIEISKNNYKSKLFIR